MDKRGDTSVATFYYYVPVGLTSSDNFLFQASTSIHDLSSPITGINLNINNTGAPDAPVPTSQTLSINEETGVTITLNGTDVHNLPLVATVISIPLKGKLYQFDDSTNAAADQITVPGTQVTSPTSKVYYMPDPLSYETPYAIVKFSLFNNYRNSKTGTIEIDVIHVNHAPTSAGSSVSTREDTSVLVILAGFDVDGDALTTTLTALPAHGKVYQYVNGLVGAEISLEDPVSDLDRQVFYTPTLYTYGSDSFSFVVYDGTVDSATSDVSITISHVNHAPTASSQTYTIDEDHTITITLFANDVDDDVLQLSVVVPAAGTLYQYDESAQDYKGSAFAATTSPQVITDSLHRVVFTPLSLDSGTPYTTFSYFVNDFIELTPTSATITINVNHVNHAPFTIPALLLSVQTREDISLTIPLQGGDVDVTDTVASLTAIVEGLPATTVGTLYVDSSMTTVISSVPYALPAKSVYFVPSLHFHGQTQFYYKIQDFSGAFSDLCDVKVDVQHVNHAPVASVVSMSEGKQDSPVTITLGGSDIDIGDVLSVKITTLPTQGTLYQTTDTGAQGVAITTVPTTVTPTVIYVQTVPHAYPKVAKTQN